MQFLEKPWIFLNYGLIFQTDDSAIAAIVFDGISIFHLG